jgi:hypothetical protein
LARDDPRQLEELGLEGDVLRLRAPEVQDQLGSRLLEAEADNRAVLRVARRCAYSENVDSSEGARDPSHLPFETDREVDDRDPCRSAAGGDARSVGEFHLLRVNRQPADLAQLGERLDEARRLEPRLGVARTVDDEDPGDRLGARDEVAVEGAETADELGLEVDRNPGFRTRIGREEDRHEGDDQRGHQANGPSPARRLPRVVLHQRILHEERDHPQSGRS